MRGASGFTLIEMLAVVLLTGLVLTAAVDSYLDLGHATRAATESTREARRAVTLLDRLAHDLEGTVLLVKPPETDPLFWPWLFLAEADSEDEGARRVRFVTRSHRPRASASAESDLALVTLVAEPGAEGDLELWRQVRSQLPEELDRSFPRGGDEGTFLLADGLAAFGMRFTTEEGETTARFDSSTLVQSGQLPESVEIELAFAHEDADGFLEPGPSYRRQVRLPLRPLDLEAELALAGGGNADDEKDLRDCVTLQQCLANPSEVVMQALAQLPDAPGMVEGNLDQCIEELPIGLSERDCQP